MARRGFFARAGQWLDQKFVPRQAIKGYYKGASSSRLTDDWYTSILSADQALKSDLRLLRARSRQMVADDAHAAGFIASLKDNVIGWEPDGIRMQARNRDAAGKLLLALNQQLEQRFQEWGLPGGCTADGYDGWGDLQRLFIGTLATDGEFLARRLPGFDNPFGYALQLLDPDLLDVTFNTLSSQVTGNEVRMGVEINGYGRPIAYWLWERHPSDPRGPGARRRIDASEIIHRFVRLRPGQTRGVPWFTPVLIAANMLAGYTEAEITQARLAASTGGFFEMTGEDAKEWSPSSPAVNDTDTPNQLVMEVEPGIARELPPGRRFVPWDSSHPNGNFAAFQKAILRTIARGLNVSYTTYGNDLEAVNYSSIRAGLFSERDGYRALQRFTTTQFSTTIYRDFLKYALLAGQLQLPTYRSADWTACKWEYRGWPWTDPLNDIQATEHEIRLGLNSRQRVCAERGRDFEEILAELVEEQALANKAGIDVDGIDAARWGEHPNDAANRLGDGRPPAAPPAAPPTKNAHAARWVAISQNGNGHHPGATE